ncbi:MAG: hypothetical protein GY795_40325 [Desulfobacterales bacterium]|nr:hypothetical protein [Desulfobacterales bacterium]
MERTVISSRDVSIADFTVDSVDIRRNGNEPVPDQATATKQTQPDKYTDRLLKYIPSEIIALYLSLDSIIRSSQKIGVVIYWGVFIAGIVMTYLYLYRVAKVHKQKQLLISVASFCVWVFALGGPFVHLSWYDPVYGGLLLPIFTFLIPIIEA